MTKGTASSSELSPVLLGVIMAAFGMYGSLNGSGYVGAMYWGGAGALVYLSARGVKSVVVDGFLFLGDREKGREAFGNRLKRLRSHMRLFFRLLTLERDKSDGRELSFWDSSLPVATFFFVISNTYLALVLIAFHFKPEIMNEWFAFSNALLSFLDRLTSTGLSLSASLSKAGLTDRIGVTLHAFYSQMFLAMAGFFYVLIRFKRTIIRAQEFYSGGFDKVAGVVGPREVYWMYLIIPFVASFLYMTYFGTIDAAAPDVGAINLRLGFSNSALMVYALFGPIIWVFGITTSINLTVVLIGKLFSFFSREPNNR